MPIGIEELQKKGKDVSRVNNAKTQIRVAAFLKKHQDQAFTQKEIGVALKIKPQQARQCCVALLKKGQTARAAVPVTVGDGVKDIIHWRIVQ